jgi:hypothetical protein
MEFDVMVPFSRESDCRFDHFTKVTLRSIQCTLKGCRVWSGIDYVGVKHLPGTFWNDFASKCLFA